MMDMNAEYWIDKSPVTEKLDLQDIDSIQMLREFINKAIEKPFL